MDQRRETAAIALALRALTRELRSASDWPRTPTAFAASSPQFFTHPPSLNRSKLTYSAAGAAPAAPRASAGPSLSLQWHMVSDSLPVSVDTLLATSWLSTLVSHGESLIARVCRHVARYRVALHL